MNAEPTPLLREIDPRAEPFEIPGGPAAALLLHGFTGSPAEMRPVGGFITKEFGWHVACPLLPGHGTTPSDLENYSAEDWMNAAEKVSRDLMGRHSEIHLVGFSMGALLCLELWKSNPTVYRSLVLIVPSVFLRAWFQRLAMQLARFPWVYRHLPPVKKELPLHPDHVAYTKYPLRASGEFARMFLRTQALEKSDSPPALIVTATLDEVVHAKSGRFLEERLSNPLTRLVELARSTHIATLGPEKDRLLSEIRDFYREITPLARPATSPS